MHVHHKISFYWSEAFLLSKFFLWSLFIINFLGTLYGYQWYWNQMTSTIATYPDGFIIFVPDSPTASLFFSMAILYLIVTHSSQLSLSRVHRSIRGFIEAFAVVTSFKYGIWAVSMIVAGSLQGDALQWQDWMLMTSHMGMAIEVLIFARFFTYRMTSIVVVAAWTLLNDYMDYGVGLFPWLPQVLMTHLHEIACFTVGLSVISIYIAYSNVKLNR